MNSINTREMILEILLEIEEGEHSHIAIRNALSKYQFLPKQERAFVTRVCEGTLEYRIYIDYIIDSFSKITVDKMKPVIREILRSAVYQLKFMDRVPDSAVCNEAVKLAQKKGFYNLKPFVNGVLRAVARQKEEIPLPSREKESVRHLSAAVFHAGASGKQMAGRLWGGDHRKNPVRFSCGEAGNCPVPYISEFCGRNLRKPALPGRNGGGRSLPALCKKNFRL